MSDTMTTEGVVVPVVANTPHPLPAYGTPDSAGLDLRAKLDDPVVLQPGERALIPTGLHLALPRGFEAQVRPRSGLAYKHGVTVLNSPGPSTRTTAGTSSHLDQPWASAVHRGRRRTHRPTARTLRTREWALTETVELLPESTRGAGGFGHTGTR